jgi:hypothetical protein
MLERFQQGVIFKLHRLMVPALAVPPPIGRRWRIRSAHAGLLWMPRVGVSVSVGDVGLEDFVVQRLQSGILRRHRLLHFLEVKALARRPFAGAGVQKAAVTDEAGSSQSMGA